MMVILYIENIIAIASQFPDVILQNYKTLVEKNGPLSPSQLKAFVDEHFLPAGDELEPWDFTDWAEK